MWTETWDKIKTTLGLEPQGANPPLHRGSPLESIDDEPVVETAVDILEGTDELLIRADVPGATDDGVVVHFDGRDRLVILAKAAVPERNPARVTEWQPAVWYRALELPPQTDGAKTKARLLHGVLTLRVPKRKTSAAKFINVRGD